MGLRYARGPVAFLVLLLRLFAVTCPGRGFVFVDSAVTDGRHSYSLTTFDPDGKLGQVERALVAASLGTPVVGVVKGNNIILASPQILPSPLMNDDGTTRFAAVSPQIVLGHSGIASDGRVVLESAQRLAIEHSYTYDEPIPLNLFLEEISLLFQSYTMKPGARPFGCTLLVGYLPPRSTKSEKPRLFQIDCSGSVVELDTIAVINGKKQQGVDLRTKLEDFAKQNEKNSAKKDRDSISRIVKDVLKNTSTGGKVTRKTKSSSKEDEGDVDDDDDSAIKLPLRIITASFGLEGGFKVERLVAANGSD
mmetsp:Transcript_661/g.1516  ORF Transcript_661/g.1516 Transcript_661/m.1516 type:complete len:307 (-) Transcript_661:45-965(-)